MLTTVDLVTSVPNLNNGAALPVQFLNYLIGAASDGIKRYCKRDLEITNYVEYYSGNTQKDIYLKEWPVLVGTTTLAPSMQGVILPTSTINVSSTQNFPPGTGGDPNATPATLGIQLSPTAWTTITYTGLTPTSFTGCQGGSGTLNTASGSNGVYNPVVYFDMSGYFGQAPNSFAISTNGVGPSTQMVLGTQYVVVTDTRGHLSKRGTLRRIAGSGQGFIGYYPENYYSGKLGAYRLPNWPRGEGNLKVAYSAGYTTIPMDLQMACAQLCATLTRTVPIGGNLASENLGGYSYSFLVNAMDPELGDIRRVLSRYREVAW